MKLTEAFKEGGSGGVNLKKEFKGVPVYIWVGLAVIGIAVALYMRKRARDAEDAEAVPEDPYLSPYPVGAGGGIGLGTGSSGDPTAPGESGVIPEITQGDVDALLAEAAEAAQQALADALAAAEQAWTEADAAEDEEARAKHEAEMEQIRAQLAQDRSVATTGHGTLTLSPSGKWKPATSLPVSVNPPRTTQVVAATVRANEVKTNGGSGNNKGGNSKGPVNKPGTFSVQTPPPSTRNVSRR